MAGNTSKIQIVSNALILLGDAPISSFNDGGAGATAASNLYESGYRNLLSLHRWKFATVQTELAKLTQAPLRDDFKYQYQLPTDYIQLVNTSAGRDYKIYEDKIYTNAKELFIDYIYRVNEDMLPDYFIMTLQFFFASLFAIPVTGNSTRADEYRLQYEAQFKRAKFQDSTAVPNIQIQHRPYLEVRN